MAGPSGRVLMVSMRLPVTVTVAEGTLEVRASVGGLATGLGQLRGPGRGQWIGWAGLAAEETAPHATALARALDERGCVGVDIPREELTGFYDDFANGVVWPLLHDQAGRLPLELAGWDAYRAANRRFADAVVAVAEPGDTIWVHDYQLCLVPALVRARLPRARIGFFLHVPFPPADIWDALPQRAELLAGICGADLVGVHTHGYLRHFIDACERAGVGAPGPETVRHGTRLVRVGAFPLGIDPARFEAAAATPQVAERVAALRASAPPATLLGVDRLDYTKGIPRRLLAYERLLERHPALHGRVQFVQLAVPSRDQVPAYQDFREEVEWQVGRINGRFGRPDWTPVRYVHRAVPFDEVVALYRSADVMLVTPLRDGLNLVCKEYCAARIDEDGALVLSEFAGAADELAGALRVNPYDVDATAAAIHRAITMPQAERRARMRLLRERVRTHDVARWAHDFLGALAGSPRDAARPVDDAARTRLVATIREASALRLLLDYDGTLVPFTREPQDAVPDAALVELIAALARRPDTEVHIVSGRRHQELDAWFGALPIGLHAEHGLWSRGRGATEWRAVSTADPQLLRAVTAILERFAARVPGAILEPKTAGVAWHWRAADPEVATWQSRELAAHLRHVLAGTTLGVTLGDHVVEVRPAGVHKGRIATAVAARAPREALCVAIGDDATDADLFAGLPAGGLAIAVGERPAGAQWRVDDHHEVRRLLEAIVASAPAPGAPGAGERAPSWWRRWLGGVARPGAS